MPEGPLGGPRPFAKEKCTPLLSVNVQLNENRWKYDNPEGYDKLMTTIGDATGYVEQNIYIRPSQGPAEARDFYGYIETAPGEYFSSVARKVERLEEELQALEGIESVGIVLDAGDAQQKIRE